MRPVLKPALRPLWRDDSTLQLGVDPAHAVVLSGLDPGQGRWIQRLDGSMDEAAWLAAGAAEGLDRADLARLLRLLSDAGALEEARRPARLITSLPTEERDRLAPDLAALSLLHREPAAVLTRRLSSSVEVHGLGRVGSGLCALLAAAGVGRVVPVDPALARPRDSAPGGLLARDAGVSRERATRRAIQRASRCTDTPVEGRPATLVVLASDRPPVAEAARLLAAGVNHLLVGLVDGTGVVGPLVVPGRTACARCLDLHRTDRDAAWPRLLAQLATQPSDGPCDVVLAAQVSALAAAQVLDYLDNAETLPATANGTLELTSPGWRFGRRSWPPHPACGCGWRQEGGGDTMTG